MMGNRSGGQCTEGGDGQRKRWAEGAVGLREQSDCLATSRESGAVQDRVLRSAARSDSSFNMIS